MKLGRDPKAGSAAATWSVTGPRPVDSVLRDPEFDRLLKRAVEDTVQTWQMRRLPPCYALMFFGTLTVKVRAGDSIALVELIIALGITAEGKKEISGIWLGAEAPQWCAIAKELKGRGVSDILNLVHDDLPGFLEGFAEAFPNGVVQMSIVHWRGCALKLVANADRATMMSVLNDICYSASYKEASARIAALANGPLGQKYPAITAIWKRKRPEMKQFFSQAQAVREIICGTNATESLIEKLRRRGRRLPEFFADESSAVTHFALAAREFATDWKVFPKDWLAARNALATRFGDRLPL